MEFRVRLAGLRISLCYIRERKVKISVMTLGERLRILDWRSEQTGRRISANQDCRCFLRRTPEQKGNANRATLAVARKMVVYLLAVDRQQRAFIPSEEFNTAAA